MVEEEQFDPGDTARRSAPLRVRSGRGNGLAPRLMEDLDWSPLGYVPVPGTLNVRTPRPLRLRDADRVEVGGHSLWPVEVEGLPGHVLRWAGDSRTTSYELVGPQNFLECLGREPGARVELTFPT